MPRFESILETIGNTPVVRINNLAPDHVNLYVKIEAFNPLGSIKDRLALGVIEDAEHSGALKPGQTVVESTSGNTGIGLAMVCAQKGYPLVVTMTESFSVERRKLMRFLGAKVVLTPAAERSTGMINKARALAEKYGWFMTKQFENEANPDYHSQTTAQEILRDFTGEALDYWVTGYGTGGTLKGVARVLAAERPETKIIVCEAEEAPVLSSGEPQQQDAENNPVGDHPAYNPHPLQGWGPNFISKEGIFVGITAGATFAGALKICEDAPEKTTLLCMLPDTGERYLSTPLFADIASDMTDEEIEIAGSTPNNLLESILGD